LSYFKKIITKLIINPKLNTPFSIVSCSRGSIISAYMFQSLFKNKCKGEGNNEYI